MMKTYLFWLFLFVGLPLWILIFEIGFAEYQEYQFTHSTTSSLIMQPSNASPQDSRG